MQGLVFEYCHKALSLGLLYYANSVLASACAAAHIKFPSPLIGARLLFPSCLVLHACAPVQAPEGHACGSLGQSEALESLFLARCADECPPFCCPCRHVWHHCGAADPG